MRYVLLFALVLIGGVEAEAGDKIEIAEYRANVDDVTWRIGVENGEDFGDGVTEPWSLSEQETKGSFEKGIRLGSSRLSGKFDIYHRQSFSGSEPYDMENVISIRPGLNLTQNSFTNFYYSLSQEQLLDEINGGRWGGDSNSQRTGLTQTWYLGRHKARISMGYGFEQSETDELYDDLRAHSLIFSSRFPLFWGLSGRLQANYAQNTYLDYLGVSEVESDKQMVRAAIDRSFSQRLFGEFQFSYLNEDFDEADLSYRRYVWGLNLRYRY